MSLRQGNTIIAGATQYHPDLFDAKWADHILNDIQWLRADTFSWQDGSVYEAAYNHLEADITGKSLSSETVSGITVQFYLADDGHKICPASEESNVASIYSATGVAWYYILDTVNQRFKLPRTQYGFTGLRDTVGKYVEAGLPNITGSLYVNSSTRTAGYANNSTGSFYPTEIENPSLDGGSIYGNGWSKQNFDASLSNSIYGNSNSVQPPATQMYLYFYVGNFTQTALENTAGLNASLFNNKADLDFANTDMIDYVVAKQDPTAGNNYTWYRKYKSGWVEQGGIVLQSSSAKQTVNLPVEMSGSTYSILANVMDDSLSNYVFCVKATDKTTTSFKSQVWGSYQYGITTSGYYFVWQVNGMAA